MYRAGRVEVGVMSGVNAELISRIGGLYRTKKNKRPFNCWISPKGKIHLVGLWGHSSMAHDILKSEYGIEQFATDATDELHNRGWARVISRSRESSTQVVVPNEARVSANEARVSKPILEGLFDCWVITEYPQIWAFVKKHYDLLSDDEVTK